MHIKKYLYFFEDDHFSFVINNTTETSEICNSFDKTKRGAEISNGFIIL